MPTISEIKDYNGFVQRSERLGLTELVDQAESTLTDFRLLIEETKHVNGTRGLRRTIDAGFGGLGGWTKITVGGIDWTKANDTGAKVGVEVQVSGRSDLLAVDIIHLRESVEGGVIDIGVIIVPDDTLSRFLTDRTPNLRTALRHVEGRAHNLPIRVIAFRHDGIGEALPKMRTNLGREPG